MGKPELDYPYLDEILEGFSRIIRFHPPSAIEMNQLRKVVADYTLGVCMDSGFEIEANRWFKENGYND